MVIKKQNMVFKSKVSIAKVEFKAYDEQKLFESKLDLVSQKEVFFKQKKVKVYLNVRQSLPKNKII